MKSKTMAGFRAPYVPGLGLPRPADRIQGGEGIARPFAARSAADDRRRSRANSSTSSASNSSASASSAIGSIRISRWTRPTKRKSCAPSRSSWKRAGLRKHEAGLLEHRRADRPGRGRSGIPGPRGHRGLCEVSDRDRRISRARRASSSGRRLHGRCRQISRSRCIRKSFTSRRNSPTERAPKLSFWRRNCCRNSALRLAFL